MSNLRTHIDGTFESELDSHDHEPDDLQVIDELPGETVKRKVKKQRVGVGKQSATILRVLPSNNASLPMQACERLRAKLTVAACAKRWEMANADGRVDYGACSGCDIGERNAMGHVEESTIEESFGEPPREPMVNTVDEPLPRWSLDAFAASIFGLPDPSLDVAGET